jgi:CubicO group peptidase (beta-lactamase class C family)
MRIMVGTSQSRSGHGSRRRHPSNRAGLRLLSPALAAGVLLLLAPTLALPGAAIILAAQQVQAHPTVEAVDRLVEQARQDWEAPGVGVAIVHGDSVWLARGWGVRTLGTRDAVDENTIFAIGSTTKAFTSAAIGVLVDEGKLDWGDRVVDHLPGFRLHDPYVTGSITIRDLLIHTSGLPRGDLLWYASGYDRSEVLRRVRHLEPEWGFRERLGYQNIMYLAAGEVVREVSGLSWDDFIRERFFRPLGMARSGTSPLELEGMANVAFPHVRIDGELRTVPYRNLDNVGPAGSINSSVREMAEWVRLHLRDGRLDDTRIFSEDVHRELFTPHLVMPMGAAQQELYPETHLRAYAKAWVVSDYRGLGLAWHNGGIDGMRAEVALIPELDLGIVVLANLGGGSFTPAVLFGIMDLFIGPRDKDWSRLLLETEREASAGAREAQARADAAREAGTSPSLPLSGYAGRYDSALYGDMVIQVVDGALRVSRGPHVVGTAEHWHHDTFRVELEDPVLGRHFLTFTLGPQGGVTSAELGPYGPFRPLPPEQDDNGGSEQ